MGFKTVTDLDAETTVAIGGFNKKTKRDNPTSVEGYYLGKRDVASKKAKSGFCSIYYFQTPKGNVAVWGKTDMDRKMSGVIAGTMTRVSFDKMVPTPNGEMYKYKVEFDPENTIEVTQLTEGNNGGGDTEYSDTETTSGSDYEETTDENEDAAQAAALAAAERKARVQDLLKGNKGKGTATR